MTSMVESEVSQGMILLHTPGTQGSIKHSELFCKGKYMMDLTGRCVSLLAVCLIHCEFTSNEQLDCLPPVSHS